MISAAEAFCLPTVHLSGRWKNSPALRAVYFKTPIQKQNTVINLKECISDDVHSFYYNKPAWRTAFVMISRPGKQTAYVAAKEFVK